MPNTAVSYAPEIVEDGQFDDAPGDPATTASNPRQGHTFIDEDQGLLEWSSDSSEEDESEPDEFQEEEDALEAEAFQTLRAEDEDWEIAEGDFTKQYNRIRQHVAVRTGEAQGIPSALNSKAAVATLPAVNRPRLSKPTNTQTSQQQQQHARDKTENQLQALSKYSSRLRNLDISYDLGVGVNRKGPSATANMKDKSDRATSEQVLDPRTRIILFKMIGRGLIYEVNGCVSTGKEANVYHALTPEFKHLALKIYKTSILVFKDRDRYVSGEFRFRRGYSRHNPRKMVRVWAEKEMRNLKRLRTAGIRCPEPVEVRENVLVMTFVGDREGWASPRLKDADIPETAFPDLYVELMLMTRKIFTECKLVHADLSEYNILYHIDDTPTEQSSDAPVDPDQSAPLPRGHLHIIDVSQSVEHDHPHAFDFLRSDLRNIEDFFSKRGVHTIGLRRAFEFVTSEQICKGDDSTAEDEDAVLRRWMDTPEAADGEAKTSDDAVFMRSYIPRTLNEVFDPERDVDVLSRGEGAKLIYKDTIGIVGPRADRKDGDEAEAEDDRRGAAKAALAKPRVLGDGTPKKAVTFAGDDVEEDSEEDGEAEEGSVGEGDDGSEGEGTGEAEDDDVSPEGFKDKKPRGHRHEDKEEKKVGLRPTGRREGEQGAESLG
ncbi:hypothetical protein V8D89_012908 [Ganoderma adspersum]